MIHVIKNPTLVIETSKDEYSINGCVLAAILDTILDFSALRPLSKTSSHSENKRPLFISRHRIVTPQNMQVMFPLIEFAPYLVI